MRLRVPAAPVLVLLLALFLLPACASRVDREALWDAGGLAYNNQWYADCIRYNHLFARKFPDDRRAPQAVLREGICSFHVGRFDDAIACYSWVEMYHPNTPFHADALFLRGMTYARQGGQQNMAVARNVFVGLVNSFPNLPVAETAKDMIRNIDNGVPWEDDDLPGPAEPPAPSI